MIQYIMNDILSDNVEKINVYRIIDVEVLNDIIVSLCCPQCINDNSLVFKENIMKKKDVVQI